MTDDSTRNSAANSHGSGLAQKLQRRVVESAGVINVRQLPTEQTRATIHRMVEREHLPSQIESRYRTVGLVSPLELPGRSRVETLDQGTSALVTPTLPTTLQRAGLPTLDRAPMSPMPRWESAPSAAIAPPPTQTFRVSRNLASDAISPPIPSPEIGESSPAAMPSNVAEPAFSNPESIGIAERVRVQRPSAATLMRREEAEMPLVMTEPRGQATTERSTPGSIASPAPTETASTASASLHRSPDSPEPSAQPSASPTRVVISQSVTSATSAPFPLVIARSPTAPSVEETAPTSEVKPSEGAAEMPRVQAKFGDRTRSPTDSTPSATHSQPLVIARFTTSAAVPENARLQTKRSTMVDAGSTETSPTVRIAPPASENASPTALPPTTVMIQPLAQSSESGGNSGSSVLRRHPAPEPFARSPLPLHTQIPLNTLVRQPESSGTVEAVPTPATPPPPPPAEKSATEPETDVKQIAEQVSRILMRQLTVERERRGMQRW